MLDDHTLIRHLNCPTGKILEDGDSWVWPEMIELDSSENDEGVQFTNMECSKCKVQVLVEQFA